MSYDEFIQNIIQQRGQWNSELLVYENHRIIPKCLGGKPENHNHTTIHENLIWLTPQEHFIAHRLLALEHPDDWRLIKAYTSLAFRHNDKSEHYIPTEEEYQEALKLAQVSAQLQYNSLSDQEKIDKNIKISHTMSKIRQTTRVNSKAIPVRCINTGVEYQTMGDARKDAGITKYELNNCLKTHESDTYGNYWEYV